MKIKAAMLLVVSLVMSGCTIHQTVEPAQIDSGHRLCIVENPAVREGFLPEFISVLERKNIAYEVVGDSAVPTSCEWVARYTANWSWDLALYMSYAEIKVYRNGSLDGEAIYDSTRGGANMNKFIDAETKIQELVDQLLHVKMASLFSRSFG
ncbi:Sbal_3080 family lipoprotein [Litchfieldella rifensis]|uniref:Sbal_3080 family lipoprotein n=1 Tax=Litchfieldella rifensis TaxID=762643 RepID=A0ABV7LPU3_9GAMM